MDLKRKFELALAVPAMVLGTTFMGLSAHYGLVTQIEHAECTERLEAEQSVLYQGISRSQRIAEIWQERGFSTSVLNDGTIEAELEACRNPDLLSQASIFVGTKIMDPIIDKGNELFGHEELTLTERTTESAREIYDDTSEGVANRWERTKEWGSDSWSNLTDSWDNYWNSDEEETLSTPDDIVTIQPQQAPISQEDITVAPPAYNDYGDVIAPEEPSLADRTVDAIKNFDWTPWN